MSGLSTIAIVRVQVTDVNDNRPIFEPRKYNVTLRSDSPIQGPILRLVATDLDAGLFGQVAYRITSGNEAGVFHIDRNTGELQVGRPNLLSRSPLHQLNVTATDAAGLKSTFDAEIRISTSSPGHRIASCEKPRYTITVKETVPQNSIVGGVKDGSSSSSSSGKSNNSWTSRQLLGNIARIDSFTTISRCWSRVESILLYSDRWFPFSSSSYILEVESDLFRILLSNTIAERRRGSVGGRYCRFTSTCSDKGDTGCFSRHEKTVRDRRGCPRAVKSTVNERPYWAGFGREATRTTVKPGDKMRNALHFTAEFMATAGRESSARDRVNSRRRGLILSAKRAAVPSGLSLGSSIVFLSQGCDASHSDGSLLSRLRYVRVSLRKRKEDGDSI
ncbi:hypothetical protein K0M31_004907 [Melipona bicolor]|uniref:Cadherin domain-containing protein n=1 Tax=Melipona bicolor TaxID=60889 RepID=A0AA40FVQ6_9HYME|nr:hypothetical protein K0M31_004907 [Melipona bicolor]